MDQHLAIDGDLDNTCTGDLESTIDFLPATGHWFICPMAECLGKFLIILVPMATSMAMTSRLDDDKQKYSDHAISA